MTPAQLRGAVFSLLFGLAILASVFGCRNPAQSSLPPSALSPPGTPVPQLAKGDVYADETQLPSNTIIRSDDLLDVVIRRGAGEEKMSGLVRRTGWATLSFVEVDVRGLTVAQATERIQDAFKPYMRNPQVQVSLKREKLKVKRVFVFGDVKKPGMYPMNRGMTVMEALLAAESYKETALLDEVRVVRGNLDRPTVLTADLARLLTYGDATRNLKLEENDIVYVPRERLGDATQGAKKLMPILQAVLAPLQAAFFGQVLASP